MHCYIVSTVLVCVQYYFDSLKKIEKTERKMLQLWKRKKEIQRKAMGRIKHLPTIQRILNLPQDSPSRWYCFYCCVTLQLCLCRSDTNRWRNEQCALVPNVLLTAFVATVIYTSPRTLYWSSNRRCHCTYGQPCHKHETYQFDTHHGTFRYALQTNAFILFCSEGMEKYLKLYSCLSLHNPM